MAATMYEHPSYIEQDICVSLPNCMYKMTNLQSSLNSYDQKQPQSPELVTLLRRQENILNELDTLKKQLDALEKKVVVRKEDGKAKSTAASNFTEVSLPEVKEELDVVITANPTKPPISALLLLDFFKQNGIKVTSAFHKHSSLKEDLPDKLMKCFTNHQLLVQPHQMLNFTFIWKEDLFGPSLIVSPRVQTPIKGDANIARYLCRKFAPHLYEGLQENDLSIADSIMEISSSKILNGSLDDTKKALKSLDKLVGSENIWLIGNRMTIADIVLWSALLASGRTSALPQSLQKWAGNLKKMFVTLSKAYI
ncbi:aminoacyl tRNA synthase complex-interacting multifunctional protein 2-like [Rhopilema esculentum]|uniref:aminoacyl tRNA synthase complex-interacting multifunctional protein 2-like n=1 Tax=Rhopilema esculentum TaxID=499914 RepID=UPI0031DB73B5